MPTVTCPYCPSEHHVTRIEDGIKGRARVRTRFEEDNQSIRRKEDRREKRGEGSKKEKKKGKENTE
jgi:transposase-like protein